MYDASDFIIGVVLGQKIDCNLHVISYATHIFDEAQCNYHTMEKEFFAVIFSFKSLDYTSLKLK